MHGAGLVSASAAEISARIDSYIPRALDAATWSAVAVWCRATVRATNPTHLTQVTSRLQALSQLAAWGISQSLPVTTEALLSPDTVDRFYLVGMRHLGSRSRATEIARLRQIGRTVALHSPWPPPPTTTSRSRLSAPYAPETIASYWSCVDQQSTALRRHDLAAVLTLVLGAGLRGPELFTVTSESVRDVDGVTTIDIVNAAGVLDRTVPVRATYVPRLRGLADETGSQRLIRSQRKGRDRGSDVIAAFELPGLPSLSLRRLRSTGLAEVIAGPVIVADVLAAAGVQSARMLSDILSPPVPDRSYRYHHMMLLTGGSPC